MTLFSDDFNFVAIATDKMENGEALMTELAKGRQGGLPWIVILNGEGEEIISSVGPEGNVGCPATASEIEHFVTMIRTSSDASDANLKQIGDNLSEFHKKK